MCFAPQRRALLNISTCVLTFWLPNVLCASHHGVQFFISHLPRWLRTRRFSQPTVRPSGATNHFLPLRAPTSFFFWPFLFFELLWASLSFFLLFSSLLFSSLLFSSLLFSGWHIEYRLWFPDIFKVSRISASFGWLLQTMGPQHQGKVIASLGQVGGRCL